jgi:hypothetical protein
MRVTDLPQESDPPQTGGNRSPANGVPRRDSSTAIPRLFTQLFLFPLLIVTVGVLVYLFFRASAEDNRSVSELISDIESGGSHARKQDMYALAVKVRDLAQVPDGAPAHFSADETKKLLGFLDRLDKNEDPAMREYLIAAIGRGGDPALTVPVMTQIALGEGRTQDERIYAVQALALSRSPGAVNVLHSVVETHREAEDWDLRWVALAGLANIGDKASVPYLRKAVGDPRREVSWSAACWLANYFGDGGGIGTLRQIVDWEFVDGQRGDKDRPLSDSEKETYMVMALEGLWKLEGEDALEVVRSRSKDTRSVKVQNAAFRILEEAKARSSAKGADPGTAPKDSISPGAVETAPGSSAPDGKSPPLLPGREPRR